jgi:hypothetical protein
MASRSRFVRTGQNVLAILAVLFGVVTIFAGFRVLGGADPGYAVTVPLLIYNTLMGFVYVAVGAIAWWSLDTGKLGAGTIFLFNLIVLTIVGVAYRSAGTVAVESVGAMVLRTVVWFVIFIGLWWLSRKSFCTEKQAPVEKR